ncbi:MAG: cache domain-containing protein, partial [Eubacterium sp.]|nr:cache domain-containing protein [Eubacterium sp.]
MGLQGRMLGLVTLPLVLLFIIVYGIGSYTVTNAVTAEAEESMKNQCELISTMLERMYPGDYEFHSGEDNEYDVIKGGYDITGDQDFMDALKEVYGDEFTIYRQDISVMTTLRDEDGNRSNLQKVSPVIVADVLENE